MAIDYPPTTIARLTALADMMRKGLHGNLVDVPVSPKLDEWVEDLDRIIAGTLLDATTRLAALSAALEGLERIWLAEAGMLSASANTGEGEDQVAWDNQAQSLRYCADRLAALRTPEET